MNDQLFKTFPETVTITLKESSMIMLRAAVALLADTQLYSDEMRARYLALYNELAEAHRQFMHTAVDNHVQDMLK